MQGAAPSDEIGAAPASWHVELWPNRSLSRRGLYMFLAIMGGCFAVFLAMTAASWQGPGRVFIVIIPFVIAVYACIIWAFAANNRAGRYIERLSFAGGRLVVEAQQPGRPRKRWEFKPYWTSVLTRTTRRTENQLILREAGRAVAIGGFLTPEERADLAEEIRRALRRFNGARA